MRSQPQEAHSYEPEGPKKREEPLVQLKRKASLFWMALKTKVKVHKAEGKFGKAL